MWSVNLPALVLLWQVLWTRLFHLPLSFYQLAMTAAAVWLVVSAERVLAAGGLPVDKFPRWRDLSPEMRAWLRLWLLTAGSLALVLLVRANWREAGAMWVFLSVSGFYLVAKWRFPGAVNQWFPVEGILPVFLTVAAVLPVATRVPLFPEPFLPLAMLTGLLFGYYLFLVGRWCGDGEECHPSAGNAGDSLFRALAPLVVITGSLALLLVMRTAFDVLLLALAISAFLLAALDFLSRDILPARNRLLADLALVSPLVPLAVGAI